MSTSVANLDTTQYVKVNIGLNPVMLQAHRDAVRIVFSDIKPSKSNTAFHILNGGDEPLNMTHTDSDIWVLATTTNSSLVITEMKTALPVDVTGGFGLNIQRGLVAGVSAVHTFGRAPIINTADGFVTVWDGVGIYKGLDPTTEDFVTVTSDSANDSVAGTGARVVILIGLDVNLIQQTETISIDGLTPVISTLKYLRMTTSIVIQAGSNGFNEGDIIIAQQTDPTIEFAHIEIGNNRSLNSAYTIPFGKVGYISSGFATLAKKQNAVCEIKALSRTQGSVFQIAEWFSLHSQGSSYIQRPFDVPLTGVSAGTDIIIQANTDTNGVAVSAGLEIILVDA